RTAGRVRNGRHDRGKSPRGWEAGGRSQNLPPPVSLARIRLSCALLGETVQQCPVDLVGRSERQFVDKPDEARMRIGGGVGKREALDLVLTRSTSGLGHDESNRLL